MVFCSLFTPFSLLDESRVLSMIRPINFCSFHSLWKLLKNFSCCKSVFVLLSFLVEFIG